jgi:hypothetical protein
MDILLKIKWDKKKREYNIFILVNGEFILIGTYKYFVDAKEFAFNVTLTKKIVDDRI